MRTLAGKHFIKGDAEGVDVATGGGWLAPIEFWRDVEWGAGVLASKGEVFGSLRQLPGNTEVQQPRVSVTIHDDVRRFDITMDDCFIMEVLQRLADLADEAKGFSDRNLFGDDELVNGFSLHIVHHEIGVTIAGLDEGMDFDDARMIERVHDVSLPLEAGHELRVFR